MPGFALWTLGGDGGGGDGGGGGPGEPDSTASGGAHRPRTRLGAHVPGPPAGARIVVACAGRAVVSCGGRRLELGPGESAFLTHADGPVDLRTSGLLAVAHCP